MGFFFCCTPKDSRLRPELYTSDSPKGITLLSDESSGTTKVRRCMWSEI